MIRSWSHLPVFQHWQNRWSWPRDTSTLCTTATLSTWKDLGTACVQRLNLWAPVSFSLSLCARFPSGVRVAQQQLHVAELVARTSSCITYNSLNSWAFSRKLVSVSQDLGDKLLVIVNNDTQALDGCGINLKGTPAMQANKWTACTWLTLPCFLQAGPFKSKTCVKAAEKKGQPFMPVSQSPAQKSLIPAWYLVVQLHI